ncbi:MAG: glutamine--tRNA ligase/YqeY domain fusion protein [Gemmatimonadota bacterium]|nr:glutamine--tRNA ligase/YqeY domain fusion protein [Gemmatimonadota bacterium]MDE2870745.1 glutamine--tRNA ligase/YqeY domain fusion protein [Gemmatimonadota bacterium]
MDFIRSMISRDLRTGKYGGRVVTRFPPEPNGFLHIGHAKSICLNFGLAEEHPGGRCHLRLDDTNPDTEKAEYVEAMKRDIRWLGFEWGEHLYHASDYFEQLYRYALVLIDKGLAYVDSSTMEEIRERRGTVTTPGVNSPWRDRPRDVNLDLFRRMRDGEFPDGSHVLRAKIDMAHRNMIMRDPLLYRIRHSTHYRQGDDWPIYPMYDFAHCLSDSVERVTHSLCTLEFENNREIYDWLLEHVDAPVPRPEQTEFAPLVLDYVITSKRKLKELVRTGHMRGWDDPRMPTLAGLRRRGVTPEAIRALCDMVGVARAQSRVDFGKFEFAVRDDLNRRAPRAFCVLDPLKVVITGYPAGREEIFRAPRMPGGDGRWGTRELPFGRELYIDREDFAETPPPGFHRLRPGGEVRLKYACTIRCDVVVKDGTGRVSELRCSFDPETRGGVAPKGRRVRGIIHWVKADRAVGAEIRLIDRMFRVAEPPPDDIVGALNPESGRVVAGALLEPGVAGAPPGTHYQFERHGYFFSDPKDSCDERLVFNRTVTMRDGWAGRVRNEAARVHGTRAPVALDDEAVGISPTGHRRSPEESLGSHRDKRRFGELRSLGVTEAAAASLVRSPAALQLFDAARPRYPQGAESIAAWLVNDFTRLLGSDDGADPARLDPAALGDLVRAVDAGEISHRQGRTVLAALLARGGSFAEARAAVDLTEIGDEDTLSALLQELVAEYPDKAAAYRAGRTGLLGFFVGRVMRRTDGKADPRAATRLAEAILTGDAKL